MSQNGDRVGRVGGLGRRPHVRATPASRRGERRHRAPTTVTRGVGYYAVMPRRCLCPYGRVRPEREWRVTRISWMFAVVVVLTSAAAAQPAESQAPAAQVSALNVESKRLSEIEPDRAMDLARSALDGARQLGLALEEAEALHNVAVAYRALGVFDFASDAARESAEGFARAGNAHGEAQAYNTLGLIALDRAEYDRALEYHLRALAIRERAGDREGLGYSYNNIGNIYRATGNYEKALEYHRQGLAIKIQLGNKPSEAFSHHNIGRVYQDMGDSPRALESYRKGLALREALGDRYGVAASLNSIGQVEEASNPRAALATYERALGIRRAMGDWRGEAETFNNIGHVYRRLGDTSRAMDALTRALAVTEKREAPVTRVATLKHLSETEDAAGNARAALAWFREYVALKDTLFNQESLERTARLQAAHESERREAQITILEQEGQLAEAALNREAVVRWALIAVLALVVLSLATLYARFRFKQQSEARLRSQAAALAEALDRARTLRGLLPICASCKKIRDDNGYWTQVEAYVRAHSEAEFTHSLCPDCTDQLYPELATNEGTAPVR